MYDLHSLGWNSFQQLCLTILREVLGQTVQSFLDASDGGRDGAFHGTWDKNGSEGLTGRFVVQCKFTTHANRLLRPSDLKDEFAKTKRLVAKGLCDSYVLMTNAQVTGTRAEEIESLFVAAGAKKVLILGSTWVSQQINENKRLRMLVPRVYGLGDLSQILDERAYAQAKAVLESMREDLAKVVVTDAYQKAAIALDKHGFVLLVGEPAAGKTTIASMLAMAALDQWNATLLKLEEPSKVADRWNPDESSQFFWLDDAFGVTQYEEFLVHGWNHLLPQVRAMLRKGAKIVMTSRDYIYNRARRDLKESAFPLLRESQVVIDVHAISAIERRQMLYNHLKLGRQPRSFLSDIKPYLESIADHPRFIPEMARRLADPLFTKDLFLDPYYLNRFVEKREQLLHEVLQGLDASSKAALALIYMRNDRLGSPIELQASEADAVRRLGSDLGGCVAALEALDGSLVVHTHANDDPLWRYKHPTIADAYAATLAESAEHLGIYVQGSTPDRLIDQVTCGDVGIEKAVVVPKALFPMMLDKLDEFTKSRAYKSEWLSKFGARSEIQRFLARRCSKEFLAMYLDKHPELLARVSKPGLMLSAVPEVWLAKRLHECGLLPEESRREFIETVSSYAVEGQDTDALDNSTVRSLFLEAEYASLVSRVRSELLPKLGEIRCEHQSERGTSDTPDEHMYTLLASFETLKKQFADDAEAARIIEQEIRFANEWIEESTSEEPVREPRALGEVGSTANGNSTRSIFDDIDVDESSTAIFEG